MSDAKDNDGRPAGPRPLTLKPRPGGSVPTGTVKQSFSHGRSKTVVVETKRRIGAAPAPVVEKRPAFEVQRPAPAAPKPQAPAAPAADSKLNLSAEEAARRQRALEAAREQQERAAATQRKADEARQAEEGARHKAEAAAKQTSPEAEVAAAPPAESAPEPEAPEAPRAEAAPEPPALAARESKPEPARGGAGGVYRPGPRSDAPREGGFRREERGGFSGRADTVFRQGPRTDAPARAGETVRYSALTPRPAPPRPPAGPRGPGGPAGSRTVPGGPPAAPEIQRATRQAPRPGSANLDRRPDEDDDADRGRSKTGAGAPSKAISRVKGAPQRREGRLTIQAVAGDDEGAVERMRSLTSVRRAREREREKRKGGAQEPARASREVIVPDVITVQELSNRMAVRGVDIIKFLMREGVMLKINDVIDSDTAELVATEFGHTVRRVSESDVEAGFLSSEDVDGHMLPRPPVVTVMGHVDHGKTSLLDALRSTDVAGGEHGGITQHIGAYQVRLKDGQRVTFLDTPGHAAFSAMRARGANVTDIVVLVVAADDGVMPQTIEAIQHAKAAGAPIIVAINKIDKPDADPNRVINELLQHEIVVESLGGDVQAIPVSALKKEGLDSLVEAIVLQSEMLDLKANPDRTAEGVVIESKLDRGRGPVATVLVGRGTLKRGDLVVAGAAWGRVRALVNEREEQVPDAGPSVPVEILGLDTTPEPGEPFAVVENEARARELTEYRERKRREKTMAPAGAGASLADMMAKLQDKRVSELPVIIKADVQGSAEAIVGSLEKISTDEVRARVILSGAGAITESDVQLAKGSGSPILGFNVRASKQARDLAEREGVEIRYYAIIYDLIDDIKGVLSGMLAPLQRETFLGNAEVLQAFDISKVGRVAGCRVTEGTVRKGAKVRIIREDVVVLELGTLQTLKRFKDEVNEVTSGQECGMQFAGFQDIRVGDVIECFTVETVARTL
jgi:translation initiation factor IF-2